MGWWDWGAWSCEEGLRRGRARCRENLAWSSQDRRLSSFLMICCTYSYDSWLWNVCDTQGVRNIKFLSVKSLASSSCSKVEKRYNFRYYFEIASSSFGLSQDPGVHATQDKWGRGQGYLGSRLRGFCSRLHAALSKAEALLGYPLPSCHAVFEAKAFTADMVLILYPPPWRYSATSRVLGMNWLESPLFFFLHCSLHGHLSLWMWGLDHYPFSANHQFLFLSPSQLPWLGFLTWPAYSNTH